MAQPRRTRPFRIRLDGEWLPVDSVVSFEVETEVVDVSWTPENLGKATNTFMDTGRLRVRVNGGDWTPFRERGDWFVVEPLDVLPDLLAVASDVPPEEL